MNSSTSEKSKLLLQVNHIRKLASGISDQKLASTLHNELDTLYKKIDMESFDAMLKNYSDICTLLKSQSSILVTDTKGNILYVNENCCDMIGYDLEELIGENTRMFNSGYHNASFYKELWNTILTGNIWKGEISVKKRDGSSVWNFISIIPMLDEHNKPYQFLTLRADITEKKQMEVKANETEKQLHSLIDHSNDIIGIVNHQGIVTYVNPAVERILGYQVSDFTGSCLSEYVYHLDLLKLNSLVIDLLQSPGASIRAEAHLRHKNEYYISCEISVTNHINDPLINGVVFNVHDLTEQKKTAQRINYIENYDQVTNLPNRKSFEEQLTQEIIKANDQKTSLTILLIDLDGFKYVNDTLGHEIGDRLLHEVSKRIQDAFAKRAFIARLGGDEFVLLVPNLSEQNQIKQLAMEIISLIGNKQFKLDDFEFFISASIGVSVYPYSGGNTKTLLKHADIAMYSAKYDGKNQFQIYSPTMNENSYRKFMLKNDLQKALLLDQLIVYYQPRFNPFTKEITGAEALLRWQHPVLGLISPLEFIPLAEESGLIVPIGEWLIKKVCSQNKAWQNKLVAFQKISINISSLQLFQSNFVSTVSTILEETKLDPQWIEFEITESVIIDREEQVMRTLEDLNNMGISISLDDFGTGYSALNYLRLFPCDIIKIDKSLIKDMKNDVGSFEIVASIISLCHKLNKSVVAEGVETVEQLSTLQEIGCDEIQGYLFSKPMTASKLKELFILRKWSRDVSYQ